MTKIAILIANNFFFCFAHIYSTCFNRLDLPNYTSKKELYEKLKAAITLSAVGFDMVRTFDGYR